MTNAFGVLIIEDDFRVANINKELVEKVEGFHVTGIANTKKDALSFLNNSIIIPNLILLDVYIPDVDGLDLMWELKQNYPSIDIIMITAAKEVDTIQQTIRSGVLDYIIKPLDAERLRQTLERYKEKQLTFSSKREISQEELDLLRGLAISSQDKEKIIGPPKGIDPITLEKILAVLIEKDDNTNGYTAAEVGACIGASRSTARRYLEYLVSLKQVSAELIYGDVGRPERRYRIN
ncbi:response regulator [Sutcliffiella cohnii]|uniref:Response regulator n=1 Tax=Sutcliffiella cohnii TaxID=33932 RepID=A0A223KMW8_9BACI|nr:response regulator [Sutcliffiella cohnii]AST90841.1 response regulator [Sutcliffiella cohnii]MED4017870.1 response regulator [Sutcliffiella cohnii]